MAVFHDEVEIEDFQYDEDSETYFYPCPCGDNFCITKKSLSGSLTPQKSSTVALKPVVAQVDRAGCVLTGGDELQREEDCPTLRSDGFVDIDNR
ncbi:hypothetical protein JEQ12_001975 [Ovis aries]|uniref:Diphthamide biosynthesis protein 3 n=1 Tax=Ovis aries TaxID=9940 RepID=A0A836AFS1_SHEEP|nr:hypothetical protein JEQ12_001975 [Ovis aries]